LPFRMVIFSPAAGVFTALANRISLYMYVSGPFFHEYPGDAIYQQRQILRLNGQEELLPGGWRRARPSSRERPGSGSAQARMDVSGDRTRPLMSGRIPARLAR